MFSNSVSKHLFTCFSECISHLPQKNSLKSKFGMPVLGFGSDSPNEKWLKGFSLNSIHKLFFIDAFSNELVVPYRKTNTCRSLVTYYFKSRKCLYKKNGSNDLF